MIPTASKITPWYLVGNRLLGGGPQNVNIIYFRYYRIVVDGSNGQIGALGTLGIFVGNGVTLCEVPDSKPSIEKPGYPTKGWKALTP